MPTPALLLELFNYLASPTQNNPRHLLLRARYHYPQQIPLLADILSFIFFGGVLNTRQILHLSKAVDLLKQIIISGDLYTSLVMANRLIPFVSSKGASTASKQDLIKRCSEWAMPSNKTKAEKQIVNSFLPQAKIELTRLMSWIQSIAYFEFLFRLFNQPSRKCQEHIQSFKLQLISLEELNLTNEEIDIFIGDLTTQCEKLENRNYKEETAKCIYFWLENQLKEGLGTSNLKSSALPVETLFRLIRSCNNLACACLIHTMEINISFIQAPFVETFLTLIDQLMLCSTTNTAIHTNLILVPSIFVKIINKQLSISPEIATMHFELWKMSMQKRNLPSKLLMCLSEWIKIIIGRKSNKQTKIGQKLQLFQAQLMQLQEESRLAGMARFLQDMQIKKLDVVYQQLQPYHYLIDQSVSMQQRSQHSVEKSKIKNMKFNVSENSSKGEFNSMMESLRSKQSQNQSHEDHPIKPQQLQIYSKRDSINRIAKSIVTSANQQIDIILQLLDLLNYRPDSQLSNLSSYNKSNIKQQLQQSNLKVPFLPLFSSHSHLDLEKITKKDFSAQQTSTMSDPYGIKDRKIQKTATLNTNFLSIRTNSLKKVLKNRGVIFKNSVLQIGYLFNSLHYRRRINIFLTFYIPVTSTRVSFQNNSIQFCSKQIFHFKLPKINQQLKIAVDIQQLRLYKVEKSRKCDRFIRPKLKITYQRGEKEEQQMYQIPMQLYNLIQWQEIPDKQLEIFQFQPEISSDWLPLSQTLAKNKQNALNTAFPGLRTDPKGNILIKLRFLMQVVFARVMMVLGRCRVELMNSGSEEVLLALLSVVGREEEVNQQ